MKTFRRLLNDKSNDFKTFIIETEKRFMNELIG
jgi:hypothetical protein